MLSAWQLQNVQGTAGTPLPTVFESLAVNGVHFRRGQFSVVAAPPGAGKSAFTLTLAVKSKVPCLYFSADSDSYTQQSRMISIIKGYDLGTSEEMVRKKDLDAVAGELSTIPIRFCLDASPTQTDITLEMEAYEEVYGEFPSLVVVDNITNVIVDGGEDDPFSGLEGLNDWLSDMSRQTQACVIGLHHVTGAYNDANKPIPLSGIKGQIGRVPSMILTLHKPSEDELGVSWPKNRFGKPDPSGEDFVTLEFIGHTMTIRDEE